MPRCPPSARTGPISPQPSIPDDSTRRIVFTDDSVTIYAWPSRGGVIILEDATHLDFGFLGLSRVDPPCKNGGGGDGGNGSICSDVAVQAGEDAFCQRVLLLGAKWWDSEARAKFVGRFAEDDERAVRDVDEERVVEPTLRERRWVRVGWERGPAGAGVSRRSPGGSSDDGDGDSGGSESGGLWVLDCDTNMSGILEENNLPPDDAGRLCLAGSMEERCEILKRLGAKFFGSSKEYEGEGTFLRAWEWKWDGEVGKMEYLPPMQGQGQVFTR